MDERAFKTLIDYLERVPAIKGKISFGSNNDGLWWLQLRIDIGHDLAWQVVQELGCVINYISVTDRLPAVFYPVSPAPYLNGGPANYLSWVIENKDKEFKPGTLMKWLEGRLPKPVDDIAQWDLEG